MDRLLNVTTVLSIVLLLMVLISVRRAHIRVEYSVSWLLAGGGHAGALAQPAGAGVSSPAGAACRTPR